MKKNARRRIVKWWREIGQETRRFDESTGKTILMRVKERF